MKKLVFLLGSANMSGGTYVILQHAYYLQKIGYDVTVALVFMKLNEYTDLKNSDACWHPAIKELSFVHIDDCVNQHYDIAIFTWWATLFLFQKINAEAYLYFVQSIEARFYTKEQTFMRDLVNRTYQVGIPIITEATWIKNYLQQHYQCRCELAKNGILKSLYQEEGTALAEKSKNQLRILVEGPLEAPYKNVARTIELCLEANVGEIWLLTSSELTRYPGVTKIFSRVPISKVPEIYRSCDVLVKLSYVEGMFGPPLEMFHCGGTAIVYAVSGHDEYIQHNVNALVANPHDETTVIQYLKNLRADPALLSRLTLGAKNTASQWVDWNESSAKFKNAVETLAPNPLNTAQKDLIIANLKKHFCENISLITVKNNIVEEKILCTTPLYDSGQYSLKVPINKINTQYGLAFGKLYKSFKILKFGLQNEPHPRGGISLNLKEMTAAPNGVFLCHAQSSMFIIDTQNLSLNNSEDVVLEIEFAPLMIQEPALTDYSLAI